jgi:hypothetical protein
MYTGTLINDLLALVERAERAAEAEVATQEMEFLSGAHGFQEDVTNHGARGLTDRTVPEAAWSERG